MLGGGGGSEPTARLTWNQTEVCFPVLWERLPPSCLLGFPAPQWPAARGVAWKGQVVRAAAHGLGFRTQGSHVTLCTFFLLRVSRSPAAGSCLLWEFPGSRGVLGP